MPKRWRLERRKGRVGGVCGRHRSENPWRLMEIGGLSSLSLSRKGVYLGGRGGVCFSLLI